MQEEDKKRWNNMYENKNNKIFKNKVREHQKVYYENSDKAHLLDHADDVCILALEINVTDKYGINGYANYPEVYQKLFRDEQAQFKMLVDGLREFLRLEIRKNKCPTQKY